MSYLRLATIFGNGMVLQQKAVNRLFGFAASESTVSVELERFPTDRLEPGDAEVPYGVLFSEEDKAGRDGYFEFRLPPLNASKDPCRLTVRSAAEIVVINDILVGELWYASGQDNMAQTVRESDVELALDECVNLHHIRFFQMNLDGLSEQVRQYSYTPLGEAQGGEWQRGDQVYLMKDQSAVAFSFAVDYYNEWQIPVGVINAACPGTYIHSWLPREIVEADPIIRNHVREVRLYRDRDNWNAETVEREQKESRQEDGGFKTFPRPQTVALLDGRKPDRTDPAPLVVPRATIRKSTVLQQLIPLTHEFSPRKQPSAMFNHKVAPFVGLSLRGVLWFQGESDVDGPEYYLRAFRYLIDTFSELFEPVGQKLTLIVAQLPAYLYNGLNSTGLAVFNESLAVARHTLNANTGLVTVYDLPLDYSKNGSFCSALTPFAKREVGRRMARLASGFLAGDDRPTSAPEPVSLERIGNKWMINFTLSAVRGGGLHLRQGETVLKGFAICDSNRVFVKAEARILYGVRVLVWHDQIDDPVSLTYGFSSFNGDANLMGSDGMPVLPFRLDLEPSNYLIPKPWFDMDRLEMFGWEEPLDTDLPRPRKKDLPGLKRLWNVTKGRGELTLTNEVNGYSHSDIKLDYVNADERPVEVDATVALASCYPPLDLTPYSAVELVLLNPDHQEKKIQLLLEDANGVVFESSPRKIEDAFRQQVIRWADTELANDTAEIVRFGFRLVDPGARGSLVMIRVKLDYCPEEHDE
ncbi:MAG TPA: sialate O-acetylesterase [Clostridiaceae bacterium]|nr:sialate O-acetylesterase [Clostridiaceae bacterium]